MKIVKSFLFLTSVCTALLAQTAALGSAPYKHGQDWVPLLNGRDLGGWHARETRQDGWLTTAMVGWDAAAPESLSSKSGPGAIIINGSKGRTVDLITDEKFGDVEVYLEFLIPRKSNSGVYLQGLYEVQILDSHGAVNPGVHDCGAIYERWIDNKGVGGSPPRRTQAVRLANGNRFISSSRRLASTHRARRPLTDALYAWCTMAHSYRKMPWSRARHGPRSMARRHRGGR